MNINENYFNLIERKSLAIGRLLYVSTNGPRNLLGLEISILNKVEEELKTVKRDYTLEKTIAKARIIKTKISPAKDILAGIDICSTCQKNVENETEVSECSLNRLVNKIRSPCMDYEENKTIDKETELMLAREDFKFYTSFLKMIDEGILDNYKEILKIK